MTEYPLIWQAHPDRPQWAEGSITHTLQNGADPCLAKLLNKAVLSASGHAHI